MTAEDPVTVSVPNEAAILLPDALTSATPVPTAVPKDAVVPIPVRVILQSPVSVSDPNEDVRPLPVALTGAKVFQAPEFQVCRPHPWREAIIYLHMLFLELQRLLQQRGT